MSNTPESNSPAPHGAFAAGQMLGKRFTLVKPLGRGGMGVVWLATDGHLNEQVALKFLPPEVAADPVAVNDLRSETARSHRLTHLNIIRIHDFHQQADGVAFISMEYVDGMTFSAWRLKLPGQVFAWEQLAPLVKQLCQALDYAHGENVIHRDLKPANVMFDSRGRVKLADFGIAAVVSDSISRVSARSSSGGTLTYMSPQQLKGKQPAVADDIYALGASLYELLTGRPPFYSGDVSHQVLSEAAPPLEDRMRELGIKNPVPPQVAALIMACLSKEPETRPQTADAVARWLTASEAAPAKADKPMPRPEPPASRPKRLWVWLGAAAIVALVAGGLWLGRSSSTEEDADEGAEAEPVGDVAEESPGDTGTQMIAQVQSPETAATEPSMTPSTATNRWTNSLGMIFVPVAGTRMQFSIWDTRVQDYQAFVTARRLSWRKPKFAQGPTHPAVNVSWDLAKAFCAWLTEKERRTGMLNSTQEYRLPTDLEWSTAAGLKNETGSTPRERNGKIKGVSPWGTQWPPPRGAGNYNPNLQVDGFANTSPVGTFAPNQFGLYDMGGNVCQWCEDFFDGQSGNHVQRGGSYAFASRSSLLSSDRSRLLKRHTEIGFRCVLTGSSVSTPQAQSTAAAAPSAPTPAAVVPQPASAQPTAPSQAPPEVQDLFTPAFAALPLDERLNRVTAKLKQLNPGFDGTIAYTKSKSDVTGVSLRKDSVITNLWPLRALANLKQFHCRKSPLENLAPLADMSLELVDCAHTQVSDLSPLRTMKSLDTINCGGANVHDLSPLKGMPLRWLCINGTRVADLAPLRGMPLTFLSCKVKAVTDLSPLKEMPNLRELACVFVPARDGAILRSIKTLQTINGLPAEQFWKRVEAGESPQGGPDE